MNQLGLSEVAVDTSEAVAETRGANGMSTPQYQNAWDTFQAQGPFDGIWASPPCQTFSLAGSGSGRRALDSVVELIQDRTFEDIKSLQATSRYLGDERTGLVLVPLHYVYELRPQFVVFEQVPSVLPVWEACSSVLRGLGYSSWTGVIDAADYGVPARRKRAYLIARNDGGVAVPPPPTASVTMVEALGWGFVKRPAHTITSKTGVTRSASGTQGTYRKAIKEGEFIFKPGGSNTPSKSAKSGIGAEYPPGLINTSLEEESILQTYPPGFIFRGNKSERGIQIGNAVPPLMAKRVLEMFTT